MQNIRCNGKPKKILSEDSTGGKEGLGGYISDTVTLFKCPKCNFRNQYKTEIDHHFRLTHPS